MSTTRMSAAKWAELVAAWESSGRSAAEFASERGIAESSLRWWRTELVRRARKESPRHSPSARRGLATVPLARVVRQGEVQSGRVAIVVGAARIVVEPGFDERLLRAVVHAL